MARASNSFVQVKMKLFRVSFSFLPKGGGMGMGAKRDCMDYWGGKYVSVCSHGKF